MRFDVLTLFPEMVTNYAKQSILGIAQEKSLIKINAYNPRDYSLDKHKKVDDVIYGGGAGMLLSPQPYCDCLGSILQNRTNRDSPYSFDNIAEDTEIIITAPSGKPFNQRIAEELANKSRLIILCGRYEGFDERIKQCATREISLGDYVLTGGELAANTIIDATARLVPGVLGDDASAEIESFNLLDLEKDFKELGVTKNEAKAFCEAVGINSVKDLQGKQLLEFPQYTRPVEYQGKEVPAILRSGDHKKIYLWRLEQAIQLTQEKRKDLLDF